MSVMPSATIRCWASRSASWASRSALAGSIFSRSMAIPIWPPITIRSASSMAWFMPVSICWTVCGRTIPSVSWKSL